MTDLNNSVQWSVISGQKKDDESVGKVIVYVLPVLTVLFLAFVRAL